MTAKQFYDWQTAGGTDDVMRLVDCLERVESHPSLWNLLGPEMKELIQKPSGKEEP